jgi:hypothetical protein
LAKIKHWLYLLHHLVNFSKTHRTSHWELRAMNEFLPQNIIDFYQQRTQELA